MPTLYCALHGELASLALSEPGVFVIDDAHGRRWLCFDAGDPLAGGWERFEQLTGEVLGLGFHQGAHGQPAGTRTVARVASSRQELARWLNQIGQPEEEARPWVASFQR